MVLPCIPSNLSKERQGKDAKHFGDPHFPNGILNHICAVVLSVSNCFFHGLDAKYNNIYTFIMNTFFMYVL